MCSKITLFSHLLVWFGRKPVKELLDLEFFAEWGVLVDAKLTDDPKVIQFTIKYDAKKRKDMHKKDEAIQFDFNIAKDAPDVVVKEMVRGILCLAAKVRDGDL